MTGATVLSSRWTLTRLQMIIIPSPDRRYYFFIYEWVLYKTEGEGKEPILCSGMFLSFHNLEHFWNNPKLQLQQGKKPIQRQNVPMFYFFINMIQEIIYIINNIRRISATKSWNNGTVPSPPLYFLGVFVFQSCSGFV